MLSSPRPLTSRPWRFSTCRSYLRFCPTFFTVSSAKSGPSTRRDLPEGEVAGIQVGCQLREEGLGIAPEIQQDVRQPGVLAAGPAAPLRRFASEGLRWARGT